MTSRKEKFDFFFLFVFLLHFCALFFLFFCFQCLLVMFVHIVKKKGNIDDFLLFTTHVHTLPFTCGHQLLLIVDLFLLLLLYYYVLCTEKGERGYKRVRL